MPMIVCVCHNVNDRQIAACAGQGVRTIKQLCGRTRAGTRCGKCLCEARRILLDSVSHHDNAAGARGAALNAL